MLELKTYWKIEPHDDNIQHSIKKRGSVQLYLKVSDLY